MEIATINEQSSFLEDVIELGRANANTLGFLPRGAFSKYASEGQILVAYDERQELIGYLLYATSTKKALAYIVHLCVAAGHRQEGVAKALFDELKNVTKDKFRGIRVRCRRDYAANAAWLKLGFVATSEMPGRSKHGTTLTVWWYDYGHPTLFSHAAKEDDSKVKVAIDANVFFQLQDPFDPANEESQSLLADWLQENIELCVTHEIWNEVWRSPNPGQRKQGRAFASNFTELMAADDEFTKVRDGLRAFFPEQMSQSDESDLRQLAWAIAAGVGFFVTRDGALLAMEEQVYYAFGMRIVHPSDLVVNQDQLMREAEYQPARLAGSQIAIERVQSGQAGSFESVFRAPQGEKKAEFLRTLHLCLADPHLCETSVVKNTEERPLALIVHDRSKERELEIPIFRVANGPLSATLARHLAMRAVLTSSSEERVLTRVTDLHLPEVVSDAIHEMGFVFTDNCWVKANLAVVKTVAGLISELSSLSTRAPAVTQYFQRIADALRAASTVSNALTMLQIEKSLWPAKLTDIGIPTFVVPIWPEWAMHLFDPHIAGQDLFGGEPSLMFNVENVYYRAAHPRVLAAPARILWYVSQGRAKYQGTMAIRATSYLDEVAVDTPKALFTQFRRLGVFKWEDVFEVAKGNINQQVMAFRFSMTEVFKHPIYRSDLDKIWQEEAGRPFHILSPLSIPKERFFRLYKIGMDIR